MKTKLIEREDNNYLQFKPEGMKGTITIPVITKGTREGTNCWTWDGDLEKPTLRPSVLHSYSYSYELGEYKEIKIHFWLTNGICQCLSDCTDGNSGKYLALEELETTDK